MLTTPFPIDSLSDIITNKLHNGSKLHELKDVVLGCSDWNKYVQFSSDKYYRQLISRNNDIDILVISWNTNQISGSHDHPANGCIMYVVQGALEEDIYIRDTNNNLIMTKTNKISSGEISFIQGSSGIHNIRNGDKLSVSIHIYSPPNYNIKYYIDK